MFRSLSVRNWRQFRQIEIDFDPRLTVLTGANGSGKTTVLNQLSRHFGWSINVLATPRFGRGRSTSEFTSDARGYSRVEGPEIDIGAIGYDDGTETRLTIPVAPGPEYQPAMYGMQNVPGLFIASHRPVFFYQRVERIPTSLSTPTQLGEAYRNEARDLFRGARPPSSSFRLKEALIALATFGYGNQAVERNEEAVRVYEGFEEILRTILPASIGFERFRIALPEIVLVTRSGRFSLDAVSGGAAALIDLAWQIYMYQQQFGHEFAVVIDEPENHLHPELQRTVLPSLLRAFPETQIVVATHSPLVVTSVRESAVYVLRFGSDRRVSSELLDYKERAAGADQILRDVLGVPSTMPVWAEAALATIVEEFSGYELTPARLDAMSRMLSLAGLGHLVPSVAAAVESQDPHATH